MAKIRITKSWNTGEKAEYEIDVPEGEDVATFIRNAGPGSDRPGIWTEPDGRELENLEDVSFYGDNRVSGLIWREEDVFDSLTITW